MRILAWGGRFNSGVSDLGGQELLEVLGPADMSGEYLPAPPTHDDFDVSEIEELVGGAAGDSEIVEKLLLDHLDRDLTTAKENYKSSVWAACAAVDDYCLRNKRNVFEPVDELRKNPENANARLCMAQTQCETLHGLFMDCLYGGGPFFKIHPYAGLSEPQSDSITQIVEAVLEQSGFRGQVEKALEDFLMYRYCCLVVRRVKYDNATITRKERRFDPANGDTVESFDAEVRRVTEDPNCELIDFVKDPGGHFTEFCYHRSEPPSMRTGIRVENLSPKNLCWTNTEVEFDDQPAVHECHVWNEYELDINNLGFKNVERLYVDEEMTKIKGSFTDRNSPDKMSNIGAGNEAAENYPRVEIWESWALIPFNRWVAEGKCDPADLTAFERKFDLRRGVTGNPQRWQVFWSEEKAVLAVRKNFLADKFAHPYKCSSFRTVKGRSWGESFLDGVAFLNSMIDALSNDWFRNATTRGAQSVIYNKNMIANNELVKALYVPRGVVGISINSNDLDKAIKEFSVDDISQSASAAIAFYQDTIQNVGVNRAMIGAENSRSATGASINQKYGEVRMKEPFERFANMLKGVIEIVRDGVYMWLPPSEYRMLLGDSAQQLENVTGTFNPIDLANKARVEITASYKDKNLRVQQLTALANVYGRGQPSPQLNALFIKTLEAMDFSRSDIDYLTNEVGTRSDYEYELQCLLEDPSIPIVERVSQTDDHVQALGAAKDFVTKHPEFRDNPNFRNWVEKHNWFIQQQYAAMAQMAQMGASSPNNVSSPGMRGAPVLPTRHEGGSETGMGPTDGSVANTQRQALANHLHETKGLESAAGFVGRGAVM